MRTSLSLAVLLVTVVAATWPAAPLQAQVESTRRGWGDWAQLRPFKAATAARSSDEDAAEDDDLDAALRSGALTYDLWQWGISSLSNLGPISPIQGRREVALHAGEIRYWAPDDLELIIAASIAHQASDFKDRPFGTDAVEVVWSALFDPNISVGIAQLRRAEVMQWTPFLQDVDLLSPEVAIRVMTAKLRQANAYINQRDPQVGITDRYMLLALAQNAAAFADIRSTVDFYFDAARTDWKAMLASDLAEVMDWREQLRLVLVHLDWLVEQGWSVPAGLERDYWSQVAFAAPE